MASHFAERIAADMAIASGQMMTQVGFGDMQGFRCSLEGRECFSRFIALHSNTMLVQANLLPRERHMMTGQ